MIDQLKFVVRILVISTFDCKKEVPVLAGVLESVISKGEWSGFTKKCSTVPVLSTNGILRVIGAYVCTFLDRRSPVRVCVLKNTGLLSGTVGLAIFEIENKGTIRYVCGSTSLCRIGETKWKRVQDIIDHEDKESLHQWISYALYIMPGSDLQVTCEFESHFFES